VSKALEASPRLLAAQADALVARLPPLAGITSDSRDAAQQIAFAAYPGATRDGRAFIGDAVARGAAAVLFEARGFDWDAGWRVPHVAVADLKARLGSIAAAVYGRPSEALCVIGVTGTNGKTSCSHWIAQALTACGRRTAVMGTLGNGFAGALSPSPNTTPDACRTQQSLAQWRREGAQAVAMEVSSHGLDQGRVNGVEFDVALFTNLTRDHLDYHGTFESYAAAKAKLFVWPELKHAVINADDAFGRALLAHSQTAARAEMLTSYSRSASLPDMRNGVRHLFAVRANSGATGLDITVDGSWGVATLHSRFIGDFNVENLLAALGALLGWNVPFHDALAALERCSPPPGRMETLAATGKPLAIVDYAHTPDALEKLLGAARKHTTGKLICIFGCGGDRDPGKRPIMAAVAERLADQVIVTDDNPRTEDGDAIVADIVKGFAAPARALIERDRAAAIAQGIALGKPGDVVVIAGKGHEDYQIIGTERRHFSDREVARALLERRS
jgi:UDP-N-acetylmuramoyl-L-alanyl-D-glutamate--2,6-diaminopimelate ligase